MGDKFGVGGIPDIRIFQNGELGQYADKSFKTMKTVTKIIKLVLPITIHNILLINSPQKSRFVLFTNYCMKHYT